MPSTISENSMPLFTMPIYRGDNLPYSVKKRQKNGKKANCIYI
jgi:hypothetical protein